MSENEPFKCMPDIKDVVKALHSLGEHLENNKGGGLTFRVLQQECDIIGVHTLNNHVSVRSMANLPIDELMHRFESDLDAARKRQPVYGKHMYIAIEAWDKETSEEMELCRVMVFHRQIAKENFEV